MTANLTARGRKLVTIVDPHIKRDSNYFFYKENHDRDLFVHTKDGSEFDGELVLVPLHFYIFCMDIDINCIWQGSERFCVGLYKC